MKITIITIRILILSIFISLVAGGCYSSTGNIINDKIKTVAGTETNIIPSLERDSTKTFSHMSTPTITAISPTIVKTATNTMTPIAIPHLRIVYINSRDSDEYWTIEPPSMPAQLSSNRHYLLSIYNPEHAQLSGNGNEVVFMGETCPQTNIGIDVINFNGGNIRTLLTPDQIVNLETFTDPFYICGIWKSGWVPNSPNMIFTTAGWFIQTIDPVSDLFNIDVDTGVIRQIINKYEGGIPEISPDGKKIVLIQCTSLSVDTIDGKELYSKVLTYQEWSYKCIYPNIVWAADSSAFGALIQSEKNVTVISVDVSTGLATTLATVDKDFVGVISPTLDCILDNRIEMNSTDIYPHLDPLDGAIPMRLLKMGSSSFISFSPDGKHFAFTLEGKSSNITLYISSLNGDITPISEINKLRLFHWLNDLQFVYVKQNSIQLGDVNGNSTLLASVGATWFDAIEVK